ncbi:hypothetical protein N7495_006306 [Penicillium taxi]|uniref:uncharacterized protein n=1 Tax=Penicillium taxi TaxID=168475 RepID=UPI002544F2D1|nr:uncharacterized protein N7495_006306 [Penicillium taxi]KAJ5894615.1 hypothetical protein N7495_006306 [Penicillium taxi]
MTKRPMQDGVEQRRVKPNLIDKRPFRVINLDDKEVVHQSCILVDGEGSNIEYSEGTSHVSVSCTDMLNNIQSVQHWPLEKGYWKALVMLSPGFNMLTFQLHHTDGTSDSLEVTVNYIPLLQLPPLHLAILVAKDSPLLIDCPPAKYGAISTAHSSLGAAIQKLRLSAYMWQALTAEDFRQKGLGRRSFRLEEEWAFNSTMLAAHQTVPGLMGSVPKVHIIRSDKTVAELRDLEIAQQNPRAQDQDALHRYFETALIQSGAPFDSASNPVVAGLILDAHYSIEKSMILGHAALGCHKPDGLSLGIFGSHLTYSWPRFMEEIPACLTDMTPPGVTVGNDNGECDTMRGACFVGQGAFLHEVGHAFGAAHTTGIMARGYSKTWDLNFLAQEASDKRENEAKWDLQDVLRFKLLPHFALPGDKPVPKEHKNATVKIEFDYKQDDGVGVDQDEDVSEFADPMIKISCGAGLAYVKVENGQNSETGENNVLTYNFLNESQGEPSSFHIQNLRNNFDMTAPLKITALGLNGKERVVKNMWPQLNDQPYIIVPGTKVVIRKKAIKTSSEQENDEDYVKWAMLLKHKGQDGKVYPATSIDLCVGCIMDGAIVHYADGKFANCGPIHDINDPSCPHTFGGHATEEHDIPEGETITKVTINNGRVGWGSLSGIRMTLSNGEEWGELNEVGNNDVEEDNGLTVLEPSEGEVIVGFFGQSLKGCGYTAEFGILTAPKGVQLPDTVYDFIKNEDDGVSHRRL